MIRRFSPGVGSYGDPYMYEDEEGKWVYADDILDLLKELLVQLELPYTKEENDD